MNVIEKILGSLIGKGRCRVITIDGSEYELSSPVHFNKDMIRNLSNGVEILLKEIKDVLPLL